MYDEGMTPLETILNYRDPDIELPRWSDPPTDRHVARVLTDADHAEFLRDENGAYAFERALHLFGVSSEPHHDLRTRNAPAPWRENYGSSVEEIAFFAEDLFGNLHGYAPHAVVSMDVETGELEEVAGTFSDWLRFVLADLDYVTGLSLASEWRIRHGELAPSHRLCAKKPFVLGGDYVLPNLYAAPWERGLTLRSSIARQIRDLPEGAEVVIRLEER